MNHSYDTYKHKMYYCNTIIMEGDCTTLMEPKQGVSPCYLRFVQNNF